MARINNRPSTVASSRYPSTTPGLEGSSDQENRDPTAAARTKGKGKERAMAPPSRNSLPTPTSENSDGSRGQKRKRAGAPDATQEEDDEEEKFKRYFDPHQDADERRATARQTRANANWLTENRPELIGQDNGDQLISFVNRENNVYRKTKNTSDATIDSRLMATVGDVAIKKVAQMGFGSSTLGLDVDEFLSKCITYMRNGGPVNNDEDAAARPSQRRRTTQHRDEDEDEDDPVGEALDWEFLGRHACFPYNSRPPVPSFLLGPLSVQKKQRTQTQRRVRQTKDTAGREVRPEALTREDLQQNESNDLRATCTRIRNQLSKHIQKAGATLERAGFTSEEDLQTPECKEMLKKCKLSSTGGVPLFEYVVNPRSFGQTVENLFYVSFLIKEGSVGVAQDDDGLPTLNIAEQVPEQEKRGKESKRRQAVFSLDYGTWRDLVRAFDIRESMIPHREDEQPTQVGDRGWYA